MLVVTVYFLIFAFENSIMIITNDRYKNMMKFKSIAFLLMTIAMPAMAEQISVNSKRKFLGLFDCLEEAKVSKQIAEALYFKEFAPV